MLEYWLQNGESVLEDSSKPLDQIQVKRILRPLFQHDGKLTKFSQAFFRQLPGGKTLNDLSLWIATSLANERWNAKTKCSFCTNYGAIRMKGWIFPFIISKDKFPNLYPNGKIETHNICRSCAQRSIAAYQRAKFNAQGEYMSFILFFSSNSSELRRFYGAHQAEKIVPRFYRNWTDKQHDRIYYPYEFLAYVLYNITVTGIDQKEILGRKLGSMIFGLSTGSKKIYDNVQVLDDLMPVISVFKKMYSKNAKAFPVLFWRLREDVGDSSQPAAFIKRNLLFRKLLIYRTIDWSILENILFYNVGNNRSIPFINMFLLTLMDELGMPNKELYEQVSKEGYHMGKELLRAESNNKDRVRTSLYELRRKRKMEEFLDALNLIQMKTGKSLDDRPFKDNSEMFHKLKVFFLIGMTNAVFTFDKGGKNES